MYYIAIALGQKPFVQWDVCAKDEAELLKLGLQNNPLVLLEANVPAYRFNVCPLKITDAGELEQRTPEEMAVFETEYNAQIVQTDYVKKTDTLETATFGHNGHTFPMHYTARLFYGVISRTLADYKVMATTGIVDVPSTENAAFMTAYYDKVKELVQP